MIVKPVRINGDSFSASVKYSKAEFSSTNIKQRRIMRILSGIGIVHRNITEMGIRYYFKLNITK